MLDAAVAVTVDEALAGATAGWCGCSTAALGLAAAAAVGAMSDDAYAGSVAPGCVRGADDGLCSPAAAAVVRLSGGRTGG